MYDNAWMLPLASGVFGLLIGSFLNVVIYRLPQMLHRDWLRNVINSLTTPASGEHSLWQWVFGADKPSPAHLEKTANEASEMLDKLPRFDLLMPRSRCQQCGHQIRWYENIPVLSWLVLRGKCSSCSAAISARYPLVELVTSLLFAWCAWRWGWSWTAAAWCGFAAVLVALTLIDWDTTLLPDNLTLPLLWVGLMAAALGWTGVPLTSAVWGAIAGYLSLWLVYQGFKLATGKEGMGYGDFKLFAALGAWFGWQALVPIILMASMIGAIVGIGMKFRGSLREGGAIPFGPFLALGGITAMIFGPQTILRVVGL